MYIKSVTLQNIGPHEYFHCDLKPGLIGVLGRNGAGKSTLVNAVYGCLTNDWTRLNTTKEGVIRDMSEADDDAYVSLDIVHGDAEFTLSRWLRPNKHEYACEGEKTLTKATEIAAKLDNTLGIKRQLIDNYVFVNQGEVFSFLSATDSERAQVFQLLCNTVKAEEIYRQAGKLTSELTEVAHLDLDDNRDVLRDDIATREKKIESQQRKADILKADVLEDKVKEKAEETVKNFNLAEDCKEAIVIKKATVKKCEAAFEKAKKAEARAKGIVLSSTELLKEQKENADNARAALAQRDKARSQKKKRSELQEKLEALEFPKAPRSPEGYLSSSTVLQLQGELSVLEADFAKAAIVCKTFDEDGSVECPTCETPVDELDEYLDSQRQILQSYSEKIRELKEQLAQYKAYEIRYQKWKEVIQSRKTDQAALRGELCSLEAVSIPKGSPKEWKEVVKAYQDLDIMLENALDYLHECQRKVSGTEAGLEAQQEALEEATARLEKVKVSRKAYEKANRRLSKHFSAEKEVQKLEASIEALRDVVGAFQKQLERKERLIARAGKARALIDRLVSVREICHRDYWPRMVAENYLEDIQEHMNKWLLQFGPPFRVRVEDGLHFEFREPGCPWRSAALLSGGQKVVMALAFRRAVNFLFANEIGMMALDEPSEALDEHNLSCLREALHDLAADSRKANNQVIVITHHELLRPAFDQVIEVTT